MKTFLVRIFIFTMAALSILTILNVALPYPSNDYLQAYNMKCDLLEDTPSPRIIFVGGSNLAFGLDSRRIADSLHIHVVNTGLHVGIGLQFMIDDIVGYVKKGDILVFAPEYQHFYGRAYGGNEPICVLSLSRENKYSLLHKEQIYRIVKNFFYPLKYKLLSWINLHISKKAYQASGFNNYGDEEKHWNFPSISFHFSPIKSSFDEKFGRYFVGRIKELQKIVQVIIIPPAYVKTAYTADEQKIRVIDNFLRKNEIPFLVSPETHTFPLEDMYDSYYHLNRNGVEKYTGFIIEELRPFVGQPQD